jgi:hypothetical protein
MTTSDISRAKAIHLLRFYLQSTRLAAGLTWTTDNDAEVEMLVDYIIDATIQTIDEDRQREAAQTGD